VSTRGSAAEVAAEPVGAPGATPRHVAIIMDGNGRWAKARGLPRTEGHRRGVEAVRRAVRYAGRRGVEVLTLFSFSSENWSRPEGEIRYLLNLMRLFIATDLEELRENNVRIRVIGGRASVPADIRALIDRAEGHTRHNTGLLLVIAFNYGAREEIVRAARRLAAAAKAGEIEPDAIGEDMLGAALDTGGMPDPDLVIRTSGEQRVSNFLLWQAAYAEFAFLPLFWPDFDDAAFEAALSDYAARERRFGGLPKGSRSG